MKTTKGKITANSYLSRDGKHRW